MKNIVFAAGCFWGAEKAFRSIAGVTDVTAGYANGTSSDPASCATYEMVCTGQTGFREAVRVEYDPAVVSLKHLLFVFYAVIDPTQENRQGMDFGTQYQTGIYWTDAEDETALRELSAIEEDAILQGGTNYYDDEDDFCVELKPLENFYPAEEEHQRYLEKNPCGYCHIFPSRLQSVADYVYTDAGYTAPAQHLLRVW